MQRRDINTPNTGGRTRRQIPTEDDWTNSEWETLVLHALSSSTRSGIWGCLNHEKELFLINTLEKMRVPNYVIFKLKKEGRIRLKSDGYYEVVR